MLDYYSQYIAPCVTSIEADMWHDWQARSGTYLYPNISSVASILHKIALSTPEYSMTGYAVYGRTDNADALEMRIRTLDSNMRIFTKRVRVHIILLRCVQRWKHFTWRPDGTGYIASMERFKGMLDS